MASFLFVFWIAVSLSGCHSAEPHRFSGPTMGTTYHVTVVAESVDDKLGEQIQAVLDQVDHAMTTYDPTSELNQLNSVQVGVTSPLSPSLYEVLELSREVYSLSDGAFDPTVGPLVDIWGFGPGKNQQDQVPNKDEIEALVAEHGLDALELLDNARAMRSRDIRLDLSAIAKGYGVDQVAHLLETNGMNNYLVEVGGEMRLAGHNVKGDPWQIAIERPVTNERAVQRIIGVTDTGMATSGDYRNYFEKEGVRYSHTIDPRSGYPIKHNLASVTVLASTSALADGLATACMVMGKEQCLSMASDRDIPVYLLVKENEQFVEYYSQKFSPYLRELQDG